MDLQNFPLVSVIMATYNCEDTVEEAINSIISQTYKNWEFIICDDCSTDNTYKILLNYEKNNPSSFRIIRNEVNSKLAYSLNRCLEFANGEYIARMDSDDISVVNRFEKQVKFLNENHEFMVVGTNMRRFNGSEKYGVIEMKQFPDKSSLITGVPFCHATIMMRKKGYDILNGYTVSSRTERGQDRDMWFRFYALCFIGANITEPLYLVRENMKAVKRRTIRHRWNDMRTSIYGYKLLGFKYRYYPYIVIPIVKALIPKSVMLKLSSKT